MNYEKTPEFEKDFLSIFTQDCCEVYLTMTKQEGNKEELDKCRTIMGGNMKYVKIDKLP